MIGRSLRTPTRRCGVRPAFIDVEAGGDVGRHGKLAHPIRCACQRRGDPHDRRHVAGPGGPEQRADESQHNGESQGSKGGSHGRATFILGGRIGHVLIGHFLSANLWHRWAGSIRWSHPRASGPAAGAGPLAVLGSDSLLDHQLGRFDPGEATLLLDDAAAHAYPLSVEAVLVGVRVELMHCSTITTRPSSVSTASPSSSGFPMVLTP